jgi:predicted aspartyl protease
MIYTHEYDAEYAFGPALPVVEVAISPIDGTHNSGEMQALIDSGADTTIIPLSVLSDIDADKVGRAQMRWGSHRSRSYDVYLVMLEIGPFQIRGVRVLADESSNEIILGRNALNQMIVTLNGLANVVEISQ